MVWRSITTGWATDFKVIKINQVTESEHLLLVVLTVLKFSFLFILFDLSLLSELFSLTFLLFTELDDSFLIEDLFTVDELKELGSCEENR